MKLKNQGVLFLFWIICVNLFSQNTCKLFTPANNFVTKDTVLIFKWQQDINALNYKLEIAFDENFSGIFYSATNIHNYDTVNGFSSATFFWRVISNKSLIQIDTSVVNSFRVIDLEGLSTMTLWWDASDSLIKDGNNKVSQWYDKSGNGNDGLQADVSKQPIVQDSVLNNYPVLKFDGLKQSIKTTAFSISPPAQVFMVYNKVLSDWNNYIFDGGSANQLRLSLTGSNTYILYAGSPFTPSVNAGAIGYKILTVKQGLSNSSIRSNMSNLGTGNPGNSLIDGFVLGTYGDLNANSSEHGEIDVAEILIYSDTLTSQGTLDIENYLRYKYAPPVVIQASENNYFCSTTLYPQKDFVSYLWSTGATTKTISTDTSGTYYLTAEDDFGFTTIDTIHLIINKPSYQQLSDSLLCIGNILPWDIGLSKSIYTYQWQDGSTDSIFTITTAGQYWVKITDSLGCFKYSDTITISFDNYSNSTTLGPDVNLCSGNSIYLTAGAGAGVTYVWNDNSTNDSLQITATSGTSPYWVTATNANGCIKQDSINVTILGVAPTANFSSTITCINNATNFTDLSVPPSGNSINTWSWNFGEQSSGLSDTSTFQNPSHTYADTGTYVVRLLVTTNVGCSEAINKIIRVYPNPVANFTGVLCQDSIYNFTDLSLSYNYSLSDWSWNFNDQLSGVKDTSTAQNPSHIYQTNGNYAVQLIVENVHGCIDSTTKNILIAPSPSSVQIPIKLLIPQDSSICSSNYVIYKWNNVNNVVSYTLEVANNLTFTPVTYSAINYTNSDTIYNMPSGQYYWRCVANLNCSPPLTSFINSFRVIDIDSLSTLTLWWDASDSLIKDGNNKVSYLYDKSGNGNDGLQADVSKQPIVQDSVLNNYPVLKFDGLKQSIKTTAFSISPPAQVFMVYNKVLNDWNNYIFDGGSVNQLRLSLTGSNTYLLYAGSPFTPSVNAGAIGYKILTVKQGLGNSSIRSNMSNLGTGNPGSSVIDGFVLGTYGDLNTNPSEHGEIDVAEILIYSDTLTAQGTLDIENYLRYKYAPPVVIQASENNYFCSTTLYPQKDFVSYLWSTGDITKTISTDTSGTYYLTVTDNFGFTTTDTIHLQINRPIYTQLNDSVLCLGNIITWNIGLDKTIYDFEWQNSTTDSLFSITSAGQYWVKITDRLGCFKYSDTITISIDNFSNITTLGPDVNLCSGNYIYLTNGATQATNYIWSDTSNNDSLQVIQPMGTYTYWVTVSDSNSCTKTDSIDVTVLGLAPTADFTFNTTCLGNTTQFTDLSLPPGGDTIVSWLWDFGDPSSGVLDTSTFQNPQHNYAVSGTYTVRLIVRTNAGCEAAINKLITVHTKPSIVSLSPTNLCSNSNVNFTPSVTTFGEPVTNWNWNFGDASSGINNTSILQNPSHIFLTGGLAYPVQLIVQNMYGCADTIISGIGIKKSPIADFNYSLACKDQAIQFTDSSTFYSSVIAGTLWSFGDGITITSPANPIHTYGSNVGYQVIHVVTDNYNCKDSVIKTVQVNPVPDAYFSIGNSCINSPTDFTDLSVISSGSITNWQWDFNTVATSGLQNPQYTFNATGNVNVGLVVTSNQGCKDSLMQTFAVHPLPVADFTFTPQYGNPPLAVSFTNISSGASSYLWDFGDGSATTTITNPLHTYIDTGSFAISLTAMNNFGCEHTKIKTIPILRRLVDVAIIAIYDTLQNNYLNTSAQLVNLGTTDITSMEIYITVNNGPAIKENWTGVLPSSTIISYKSTSSVYLKDAGHYVCLTIENPNHVADENPANNKLCEALDLSVFQILDMYPNPSNEVITIPLIIPELKNLNITIYDANGKKVKSVYSGNIDKGLQLITINVMELNSGFYGCKVEYGNESFVKKFIKK